MPPRAVKSSGIAGPPLPAFSPVKAGTTWPWPTNLVNPKAFMAGSMARRSSANGTWAALPTSVRGQMPATKTDSWDEQAFALAGITPKYSPRGVRRDRSIPFLVRMAAAVTLPPGEHRLLMRAMRGGRLSIDGKIVATSDFYPKPVGPSRASDAEAIADQLEVQLVKEVA